jgi:hypothetical protein
MLQDVGEHTTLGSDNPTLLECTEEELEVGLLEQALSRALRVRRVSDDDIKAVLVILEELEAIADVDLDLGVLVADGHVGQVFLGETDNSL